MWFVKSSRFWIRVSVALVPVVLVLSVVTARSPAQTAVSGESAAHAEIVARLQEFVDQREISGAVALVAARTGVLDVSIVGQQDVAGQRPMQRDAIFWIASMTKPVTGVAVMMMEERGKLKLDDPVSQYLPEFQELKNGDGDPVSITIKQLLTHSAGLSELAAAESAPLKNLGELTAVVARKKTQFPPGSQWKYSQTGINTAARIVEVVSGKTFPEFLQQNLFQPLRMSDTAFYLNDQQVARLAKSYRRTDKGELEEAALSILAGKSPTSTDRVPLANGGLFSTADDYARFCRMLLNDGSLDGQTILRPESVQRFRQVHSGELVTGFTPGNGWGVGCCVVRQPQGVTADLSPGSFGHGGAYGTQAWIDPQRERIYILMVQRANFANSDASPVRAAFQRAAQTLAH